MSEGVGAYLLSGGGNDFLALAEPGREPTAREVRAWCRRGLSVGADGLFVLRRTPAGVAMTHYNADGGAAALCVNGARCAAQLAAHLGWCRPGPEGPGVTVETGAGALAARCRDARTVTLAAPPPDAAPRRLALEAAGASHDGWSVRVGVPHYVLPWEGELAAAPLATLGPALRYHADLAPAGANVDLVRFADRHHLEIRTWERGVEGETLACGSGVLAAVAAGLAAGELESPIEAATRGGCAFRVTAETAGGGAVTRWELTGDARLLAKLELTAEAAAVPPP